MTQLRRVVGWNAKVGRGDAAFVQDFGQLVRDLNPQVVCLQEAGGYVDALQRRFADDWRIFVVGGSWKGAQDCPVLARRDTFAAKRYGRGWGSVRVREEWIGPKGGRHEGRTWTWVKVGGIYVMSVHRCTAGATKNKAAYAAEGDALTWWLCGHRPSLVIGDHNATPDRKHDGAPVRIAAATDARVVVADPTKPGVDYALRAGAVHGSLVRGKRYGSDHRAILFKLPPTR